MDRVIAKARFDDDRKEVVEAYDVVSMTQSTFHQGATLERRDDTELKGSVKPGLDVFGRHPDVVESKMSTATAILMGEFGSTPHNNLVIVIEEVCRFKRARNQIIAGSAKYNANNSFDDIDPENSYSSAILHFHNYVPPPSGDTRNSIHVENSICQETTKCTRKCS